MDPCSSRCPITTPADTLLLLFNPPQKLGEESVWFALVSEEWVGLAVVNAMKTVPASARVLKETGELVRYANVGSGYRSLTLHVENTLKSEKS